MERESLFRGKRKDNGEWICGKTYEGDSNVVMRKSIVHLIFRHPKESAKIIIRYFKNRRQKQ